MVANKKNNNKDLHIIVSSRLSQKIRKEKKNK